MTEPTNPSGAKTENQGPPAAGAGTPPAGNPPPPPGPSSSSTTPGDPPKPPDPKRQRLDTAARDRLVTLARLAGGSAAQLSDFEESLEGATVADIPAIEKSIAKGRRKHLRDYHVTAARILHQGERYEQGETIELTQAEAELLEGQVGQGAKPKVADRKNPPSGRYKLTAAYWRGGRALEAGTEVELTVDEAKRLADQIEPV